MRQRQFRFPWLVPVGAVCVALALTVAGPFAVAAATLTAQAGTASGSPAIIVAGNGYGTNETIKLVGLTNDGRQALYPDARSDNNGAFTTSLSFDAAVARVQATGDRSRTQVVATVSVPAASNLPSFPAQQYPGGVYPGQPFPGGAYPGGGYPGQPFFPGGQYPGGVYPGGVYPGQPFPGGQFVPGQPVAPQPVGPGGSVAIGVGQTVETTASGFTANERISVWITGPDGAVTPQPGTEANGSGAVATTVSFPGPGAWAVTLFGRSSSNQVINRYEVGGAATNIPGGYPGGVYPGQPFPGGQYPGGVYPGQPFPGGGYPGQPFPGQPFPDGAFPGGQFPVQPTPAPRYI